MTARNLSQGLQNSQNNNQNFDLVGSLGHYIPTLDNKTKITSQQPFDHLPKGVYNLQQKEADDNPNVPNLPQSLHLDEEKLAGLQKLGNDKTLKEFFNDNIQPQKNIKNLQSLGEQSFIDFLNEQDHDPDKTWYKASGTLYASLNQPSSLQKLDNNAAPDAKQSSAKDWLKLLMLAAVPVIGWMYALSRVHYIRQNEVGSYQSFHRDGHLLGPGLHVLLNPLNKNFEKHNNYDPITKGSQNVINVKEDEVAVLNFIGNQNQYYFVGPGKYQIDDQNVQWYANYKGDNRYNIQIEKQKLVNIPENKIGVIRDTANNKYHFLTSGWYHIDNANMEYYETRDAESQELAYNDKKLLNIPENQVAVLYDRENQRHHFIPSGRYFINDQRIDYINMFFAQDKAISYPDKKMINVAEGHVGVVYDYNYQKYHFLAPGHYFIDNRNIEYQEQLDFQNQDVNKHNRQLVHVAKGTVGKLHDSQTYQDYCIPPGIYQWDDLNVKHRGNEAITENHIKNDSQALINIPEDQVGLVYDNRTGQYHLLSHGQHKLDDENLVFKGRENLNKEQVNIGTHTLLKVREGERVITYNQGYLEILGPGLWLLDAQQEIRWEGDYIAKISTAEDTREISRSASLSPEQDKYGVYLNQLEAYTNDNVFLTVGGSITYRIADPKRAVQNFLDKDQRISDIFTNVRDEAFNTFLKCVQQSSLGDNTKVSIMPYWDELKGELNLQYQERYGDNQGTAPKLSLIHNEMRHRPNQPKENNAENRTQIVAQFILDMAEKGIDVSKLDVNTIEMSKEMQDKLTHRAYQEQDRINQEIERDRQKIQNEQQINKAETEKQADLKKVEAKNEEQVQKADTDLKIAEKEKQTKNIRAQAEADETNIKAKAEYDQHKNWAELLENNPQFAQNEKMRKLVTLIANALSNAHMDFKIGENQSLVDFFERTFLPQLLNGQNKENRGHKVNNTQTGQNANQSDLNNNHQSEYDNPQTLVTNNDNLLFKSSSSQEKAPQKAHDVNDEDEQYNRSLTQN